jgi:hypothetical protein
LKSCIESSIYVTLVNEESRQVFISRDFILHACMICIVFVYVLGCTCCLPSVVAHLLLPTAYCCSPHATVYVLHCEIASDCECGSVRGTVYVCVSNNVRACSIVSSVSLVSRM